MQDRNADNSIVSNDVSITLTKEEFICPITGELFLNPIVTQPCGHVFEEDAIQSWRESKNTCPCCREPIQSLSLTQHYFNSHLNLLFDKDPSLYNERYFNLKSFKASLEEEKDHSNKLKKIIDFLKKT